MCRRIEPNCLPGYAVICDGMCSLERTAEGVRYGVPQPKLGACTTGGDVCWWVKPIDWTSPQPLNAKTLRNFCSQAA